MEKHEQEQIEIARVIREEKERQNKLLREKLLAKEMDRLKRLAL
jgi:hypothetical protein